MESSPATICVGYRETFWTRRNARENNFAWSMEQKTKQIKIFEVHHTQLLWLMKDVNLVTYRNGATSNHYGN